MPIENRGNKFMSTLKPRTEGGLIKSLFVLAALTFALIAAMAFANADSAKAAKAPKAATATPTPQIIGGTPVSSTSSWPFIVGLMNSSSRSSQFCDGSLIAEKWVVTAGHCYSQSSGYMPKYILIGTTKLSTGGQMVPVARVIPHESYNSNTLQNDIALVELQYAPTNASSLMIARSTSTSHDPPDGATARIAGWGSIATNDVSDYPDNLQETTVQSYSRTRCQSLWGSGMQIYDSMLCAAYISRTAPRASCYGDSGGPMTYDVPNVGRRLVGVISFGPSGCLNTAVPSGTTRVSYYNNWINSKIGTTGTTTTGSLTAPASENSFGDVNVSSGSSTRTITVRNSGTGSVSISGTTISGDFRISSNSCSGTIAAGASCTVTVVFDPTAAGTRTGSLQITPTTGATATVSLSGNGVTGTSGGNAITDLRISQRYNATNTSSGIYVPLEINYSIPAGMSAYDACWGGVRFSIKLDGHTTSYTKTREIAPLGSGCGVRTSMDMESHARNHDATVTLQYLGTSDLAGVTVTQPLYIR